MTDPTKRMAKWADESQFVAQPTTDKTPRVRLIHANNDPLGQLAFLAKTYQGIFPKSLAEITDEDRRYYVNDMEKNILGMPSEAVLFHFCIENVTRSYTHQLVRTRHASYAQESLRFAVKEDFPVALPPHLVGTRSLFQEIEAFSELMGWVSDRGINEINFAQAKETVRKSASVKQRQRFEYDEHNDRTQELYLKWINEGMPSEDARYITPHGILTRINMVIDLRALMQMAGQRLCTQAQFEHRQVWDQLIASIRNYGATQTYDAKEPEDTLLSGLHRSSQWQFDFLANRFKPICYQAGSCKFGSDFDRYCNIRDRVNAFADNNIPSNGWHSGGWIDKDRASLLPIHPAEWLDPNAAISPDGEWRSDEAKANIEGRRL